MESNKVEKEWTWQDSYLMKSYHVDPDGLLSFPQLCLFFQETAYNHADHLEFGFKHLKEQQQFWVLSRLLVKVDAYPRWRDRVVLKTWPGGVDGLFALRHFQLESETGEKLAGAVSSWLILDSVRRRPTRPAKLKEASHLFPTEKALDTNPTKLKRFSIDAPGEPFAVRYSDLDLYDHVNNARYIQWVLDSFSRETHKEKRLVEFEVNFAAEAKIGDVVSIHTKPLEDSPGFFEHCVKRQSDNRDVCLARTRWEK